MRQRLMEREQRARQQQSAPSHYQPEPPRRQPAPQNPVDRSGSMRDIAEALVSLRDDLRHDISESMNREFRSLRQDVDEIKALSGSAATRSDISQDLSHLANQLENARIAPA